MSNKTEDKSKKMGWLSFKQFVAEYQEPEQEDVFVDNTTNNSIASIVKKQRTLGFDTQFDLSTATVLDDGNTIRLGFFDPQLGDHFVYIDEGCWFDISELGRDKWVTILDRRSKEWRVFRDGEDNITIFDDTIDLEATAPLFKLAEIFNKVW
jgi:hypothetical protein